MELSDLGKWVEHPEVVHKVVKALRRSEAGPAGANYIVVEFEDGTKLIIGANDLGTWTEQQVGYSSPEAPLSRVREAKGDYAFVKAMAEALSQGEQLRLAHDLLLLARTPDKGSGGPLHNASEFYGIWAGIKFDEEDFKAVEWYLPPTEPE